MKQIKKISTIIQIGCIALITASCQAQTPNEAKADSLKNEVKREITLDDEHKKVFIPSTEKMDTLILLKLPIQQKIDSLNKYLSNFVTASSVEQQKIASILHFFVAESGYFLIAEQDSIQNQLRVNEFLDYLLLNPEKHYSFKAAKMIHFGVFSEESKNEFLVNITTYRKTDKFIDNMPASDKIASISIPIFIKPFAEDYWQMYEITLKEEFNTFSK